MPDVNETKNKVEKKRACSCCFFRRKNTRDRANEEENYTENNAKSESAKEYFEDLNEPLTPGSCVRINGHIQKDCKRFSINFLCFRGPKTDIAFHFNPRLALRYIARNARINNSWGEEENTSVEKFNLTRNKSFEVTIVATDHEFFVSLDGKHVCAFVYRIPLEKINRIQVEGPVDVRGVERKQVAFYPTPPPENDAFTVPVGSGEDRLPDQQLIVPVTATLPTGFKEGWQLEIKGRVKILPSSFYINLQQGRHLWPHPTIPLHLNPRFYTSYGNHLFVRNSWSNGNWDTEERTTGFQFTPGRKFDIAVRRHPDSFSVWVDGILAGEFKFRTPVDAIDTVYVHGDVQIFNMYLKDHVDDRYFSKSREELFNSL